MMMLTESIGLAAQAVAARGCPIPLGSQAGAGAAASTGAANQYSARE
jgi:hypothetical protein